MYSKQNLIFALFFLSPLTEHTNASLTPTLSLCVLSFSHKKPRPTSFHPQFSLPLSHLSLSLVHSMPPAWRDRRCGEIDAWRVVWSRWWQCGFELMIDGSDMGRPRWWFNLSLWCGSILICVGLLGLG